MTYSDFLFPAQFVPLLRFFVTFRNFVLFVDNLIFFIFSRKIKVNILFLLKKKMIKISYNNKILHLDYLIKYNKLANHLKKVLAKHKSESFISHLTNLSAKDGSLWKATKNACKYKFSNLPIKNPYNSYVISP